ncbi:MAG TPA: hypothetical protein VF765_18350 [Polyangiaceae bacterium]
MPRPSSVFALSVAVLLACHGDSARALDAGATPSVDYTKRLAPLDAGVQAKLVGKWTNDVDRLVVEITSVDLASGALHGRVSPTTGPAAADGHELVGWVSAAPPKENMENVVPVTFSTTLYEYGTLPTWAGFWKDGKIVTMSYLVWPNKTYAWDHISTFQETWTKL